MPKRRDGRPSGDAPKIGDVAAEAGVSPATVSRVFSGQATVSRAKSDAVREAATRLGYRPHGPARALRTRRSQLWTVIVADVQNPYFTAVVRGIEDGAQQADFRLVLCNSDEDLAKEADYLQVAMAEQVGGVVIALADPNRSTLGPVLDAGIPVVAIDRRPREKGIDVVEVDNRRAAVEATTHLIDHGWQRIACITGPAKVTTATDRLTGYRAALRAGDRPVDKDLIRRANFRQDGGYRAARDLLMSDAPPDAFLVANNLMTLGVLRALDESGKRPGRDVGLVGFDDAPWAELMQPPLTVVAQPTYAIGISAARLLSEPAPEARHILLESELIVRASSTRI